MIDLFIIVIFAIFIMIGIKNGLLATCLNFFSYFISLLLSRTLYPLISKFLIKNTPLYTIIKSEVQQALHLQETVVNQSVKAEVALINNLQLPSNLTKLLNENNNNEIYRILNVDRIEDYIGGFIATMLINTIAMIVVFLIVLVVMKTLSHSAKILQYLPVIGTLNKLGGALLGICQGILVVWLLMTLAIFFLTDPKYQSVFQQIDQSMIALWFYKNNWILQFVSKIHP